MHIRPGGPGRAGGRPSTVHWADPLVIPARLIRRAFVSFHPGAMPVLARGSYRIEAATVFFFAVTLAAIEGSFVGVFAKRSFSDEVDPVHLNLVVALLTAAPEIANIVSFVWVAVAHGRPKVPLVNTLQVVTVLLVGALALVNRDGVGLILFASLIVLARLAWSGIITIRPTIWRANYPRTERARIIGKYSTIQVLVVALVGLGLGAALDADRDSYRWFFPAAACVGILAALATARLRVRGHRALLRAEHADDVDGKAGSPWRGPGLVFRVLRRDRWFARFMLWMFVLGFGNIMLTPMVVIATQDAFRLGYVQSLTITTAIPMLLMPITIPLWARFLDRAHVVKFRSVHSWSFTLATGIFMLALLLHAPWLMYAGSALLAVGFGGGTLAWNLGHNDFAPPAQTSQYMATHVTLNGVRALVAPFVSVTLYNLLYSAGLGTAAAAWVVALSLVFCIVGSLGFVWLRRDMAHMLEGGVKRTP
ncbi:MAG: MFS transporter [Phycisphaerae bacterium]|nr:MFS transporter [Phycisphaerae bacterium]